MREYIEARVIQLAMYIIENNATVRQEQKSSGLARVQYIYGSDKIERFVWVIR